MTSIIETFNTNNDLSYSFSSSTTFKGHVPEYALSKDSAFFQTEVTPSFWQISFSKEVTIDSYSICTRASNGNYGASWEVSHSNNNETFVSLQTDVMTSSNPNAVKYNLDKTISCKHFKITLKTTSISGGYHWMVISKFDLFGRLGAASRRTRDKCSINIGRIRHETISNILILMMPSSIT